MDQPDFIKYTFGKNQTRMVCYTHVDRVTIHFKVLFYYYYYYYFKVLFLIKKVNLNVKGVFGLL